MSRICSIAGLAFISLTPAAQAQSLSAADLKPIEMHLAAELGDADAATALTRLLVGDALSWKPSTVPASEVETIVAYAFGNRIAANGNRSPGPMNEALAEVVVKLHRETSAPVYAQWEIAEAIGERIAKDKLVTINPGRDGQAEPVYLSTSGVAREVIKLAGGADKLGKVAVVGFYDHLYRCVETSRASGMDAAAVAGYDMPKAYDEASGQPWTRSRLTYLMHDIMARSTERRNRLAAGR